MNEEEFKNHAPFEDDRLNEGFRQLRYEKFKEQADAWLEDLPLTDPTDVPQEEISPATPRDALAKSETSKAKPSAKIRPLRRWLAFAAGVFVLATSAFLLRSHFTDNSLFTNNRMAIAAAESFQVPVFKGTRGGLISAPLLEEGIVLYLNKDYDQAREQLLQVDTITGNTGYQEAQIVLGLIALETGQGNAVVYFENIDDPEKFWTVVGHGSNIDDLLPDSIVLDSHGTPTASGIDINQDSLENTVHVFNLRVGSGLDVRWLTDKDLQWYKSLAFLQNGNEEKGVALLERIISNESHPFFTEAQSLLERVR